VRPHRRALAAAFVVPLTLAASRASPDPTEQFAGRYYEQFPEGTIDGDKYTGENIVEIVPVAPRAAYIRVHLDFYNGHACSIYGVAQARGTELLYDDKGAFGDHCVLTVRRSGSSLSLDDHGGTCKAYCGARGSLSNVQLPYASKRPIGYLDRLKRSSEYQHAIATWRAVNPPRQ
jgi:hypothetical protein